MSVESLCSNHIETQVQSRLLSILDCIFISYEQIQNMLQIRIPRSSEYHYSSFIPPLQHAEDSVCTISVIISKGSVSTETREIIIIE
jgi:hypothetical protein